ncbi:MAG: glycogen debranching enzyme family protein [Bacteroidales bacterium]|nr:glycogen debranching enzyme family protein [Bacteroidales bacterium]MCB8998617.1 glycogen debranching enzyme family protein [Bacteroidales bacterium]
MGYLQFDKSKLINLEYSLDKEFVRSNRAGSYSSTTIVGCNTRKYHGMLVCPCTKTGDKHVLLSTLDVTVIQHNQEFNLGIHKYQGDLYVPRGHKYVRNFEAEAVGVTTYRVGGVVLTKEYLLVEKEEQILIRYTLTEATSPTALKFKPFLAFRNMHALSKANMFANTKYQEAKNGIVSKLYEELPPLYMQFNKKVDFISCPDWYYDIEYMQEQKRGYDFKEDLFVPGYFECTIAKGESIIFSGSTREVEKPETLPEKYEKGKAKRIPRDSFKSCLVNSAEQFLVFTDDRTEIVAGYPWFGTWGRDTFISLPGITLTTGKIKTAKAVIDTMVRRMKGGLFPNMGDNDNPAFNSVDAPLWFFWSLQEYEKYDKKTDIWETYKGPINEILNSYRDGTIFNIRMIENSLIWAGEKGKSLTWMDAVNDKGPVTPRMGMDVEINALWYNAVCACLEWAKKAKDTKFVNSWKNFPEKIAASFIETFWDEKLGYLADYVDGDFKDFSVRPNQVIAAAMPFTPITKDMKKSILDKLARYLVTPKGLRTLSPKDENYNPYYEGDQNARDAAYHQGTVWPWLLEHYVKAYLDIYKLNGLSYVKTLYHGFEDDMLVHGIGSISEIYDGDPPHTPRGSISQAWSVAAVLRIGEMIEKMESQNQ